MSDKPVPSGVDTKTVAFVLNTIADAIEVMRVMRWSHFSEVDRMLADDFVSTLRYRAAELEAQNE